MVDVVFLPDLWRYRELGELLLDAHFGLYVTGIVAFEQLPLVRRMEGPVPGALAICLGGEAGLAEVFDELLALSELLLLQTENSTDALQGKRQAHRSRPDHGAMPALRVEIFTGGITEIPGEAHPLEGGIEGPLDDGIVLQRGQHLLGDVFPTSEVDHLHRPGVDAVAEQQDFKIGRPAVAIDSGLLERDVAIGLDVDTQCFHRHVLSEQRKMGGRIAPTTHAGKSAEVVHPFVVVLDVALLLRLFALGVLTVVDGVQHQADEESEIQDDEHTEEDAAQDLHGVFHSGHLLSPGNLRRRPYRNRTRRWPCRQEAHHHESSAGC